MKMFKLTVILTTLALTTALAGAADAPAKKVTTSPEGCQIVKYAVHSTAMDRDIQVVIVLPPGYDADADKTYPVLYALHGRGAPYTVWSDMSLLRKALKDQPMIVASFNGDYAGWYVDATQKPQSLFRTFFFDEFMPHVESAYRANGVRGLTGFSMGGYGALYYMTEKPELFASVSGLSTAVGCLPPKTEGHKNFVELLGPYETHKAEFDKRALAVRVTALVDRQVKLPPIMLHCGTEDSLLPNNRAFRDLLITQNKIIQKRLEPQVADVKDKRQKRKALAKLMAAHRINFTYTESPGAHTWSFWLHASPDVADFHWKSFAKARPTPLSAQSDKK